MKDKIMEKLKQKFEKIKTKYLAQKEKFQNIIQKWQNKGKLELYNEGSNLLSQIDNSINEIEKDFASTSDKSVLKTKIKKLKKTFKQLKYIVEPVWWQWLKSIVFAGIAVFFLRNFVFGLYHVPTQSAEPTILVGDRLWGNKLIYSFKDIKKGEYIVCDNPLFKYDDSNSINYFWQKYVGFGVPLLGLGDGPDNWTKRIIAVPGDVIEGRIEDGKTVIYINEEKINESYVNPYPLIMLNKTSGFVDSDNFGPLKVPLFLRKTYEKGYYAYDPEKSFEDQPFYNMPEKEVVKKIDGSLVLREAYSPTYGVGIGGIIKDVNGSMENNSVDIFGPFRVPEDKYWVMGDNRKNSMDSRYWGFLDKDRIQGRVSFVIWSLDSKEPFWLFELIKHPIDFWKKSFRWNRVLKGIK